MKKLPVYRFYDEIQVQHMSVQLLDRIRKVNRLLHNNAGYKISVDEVCGLLGRLLLSDVLLINAGGTLIGIHKEEGVPQIEAFKMLRPGDALDGDMNERFISVLSTKENVNLGMMGFQYDGLDLYDAILVPVGIAGERLGTVFVYRIKNPYEIDDIILCEYVATIVAMELLHDIYEAGTYDDRKEKLVYTVLRSLSLSERRAARCVFEELAKTKGVLVTSRVAEKYGITRSVVVNAIKKLNGAGVIRSRSMGVKGTAIQIENEYLLNALSSERLMDD